jgi:hypothetical protein
MTTANGIRKLGFKRWYERQLIESHLYLVTCFLCMVLVAACLEELRFENGVQALVVLALVAGGVWLGLRSWQRFRAMFFNAMQFGEASTCRGCGTYARFNVTQGEAEWLRVKCRKCGNEWTMP